MFFSDWFAVLRVIIVGACAYIALIVLLRASGKRTLSKMNAFDFVVTVAIGSTLATVLLSKDVVLLEGIVAFALLIGCQFVITWLSVRSQAIGSWVKSEPTLLWHRGEFLRAAMRRERVTENELLAAVREQGTASLEEVAAIMLETDGSFSVVNRNAKDNLTTLPIPNATNAQVTNG